MFYMAIMVYLYRTRRDLSKYTLYFAAACLIRKSASGSMYRYTCFFVSFKKIINLINY